MLKMTLVAVDFCLWTACTGTGSEDSLEFVEDPDIDVRKCVELLSLSGTRWLPFECQGCFCDQLLLDCI